MHGAINLDITMEKRDTMVDYPNNSRHDVVLEELEEQEEHIVSLYKVKSSETKQQVSPASGRSGVSFWFSSFTYEDLAVGYLSINSAIVSFFPLFYSFHLHDTFPLNDAFSHDPSSKRRTTTQNSQSPPWTSSSSITESKTITIL